MEKLREEIERHASAGDSLDRGAALEAFLQLRDALESGDARAALRREGGDWEAIPWVKQGILLGFRLGAMEELPQAGPLSFVDKQTFPPRRFSLADGVRVVPGGSAVRRGAYVAPGVVCMPPMYVNVGAYVGAGSMIDSHALVGSCAQVGQRVHLSAAAQLGGVLEPAGALPVIVEDDVFVGGNCGVYEGTIVRRGAILAPGVLLTGGTPLVDLPNDRVIRRALGRPLEVPERAVVVPGSRPAAATGESIRGVSLYAPVIVKYRDERASAAVQLEEALRG